MRYNAARGGHAPGHLRDAFVEWLEASWYSGDASPSLNDDVSGYVDDWHGNTWTVRKLLGHLWNCTDILPGAIYRELDFDSMQTYAAAVRMIKAELLEKE